MKLLDHGKLKWLLLLSLSTAFFCFLGAKPLAQTVPQIPARAGYVNDFAGVIDEQTRLELGNILENVKQKTGIEFAVVTVESTAGQEIFDFSRQLAADWKIGARNSPRKSLLLVVAVKEKESFTQFSRSVQGELPDGVLGEMGQRMRTHVHAGRYSQGLSAGVHHFVNSMAQKLALNTEDFDKTPAIVSVMEPSLSRRAEEPPTSVTPRVTSRVTPRVTPRVTEAAVSAPSPVPVRPLVVREVSGSTRVNRSAVTVDDDAESEEVELTLTLPVEARVEKLKAFIARRPDSKSKPRAIELLVSSHAALGDDRLKRGDSAGGIEELLQAISDAPVTSSDKLFSGVISQIPFNLYLRGERDAAITAAQAIETKFGSDPKRLLAVAGFYLGTEQGGEALRIANRAVSLAPDLAEAHQTLGLALHISLRLEDAVSEYKRAVELNPSSKGARRALADLHRAFGRAEEALALYREQVAAEPKDKNARAGLVLSLLELGRADEARSELESALKADPRNLALLTGAAYWFAAHNDHEKALEYGSKAIEIEPRYTWSQVAVARALVAKRKPLAAERALRFAKQYGKFPTLDYELASALAASGLYDEAAETLMQSFRVKDGQIETRLGGHTSARNTSFIDLLAPERRASIFQFASPDTEGNAKLLKDLLTFATLIGSETVDEQSAVAAANQFASGDDASRVHRQLYAASRLLQKGIGFQTTFDLAEAARTSADAGMTVPELTLTVQADEYREIRARAIAQGGTPEIQEAPRNVLSNLLRGRIEDLSGWALFNQDKLAEAEEHLKRAANILPEGTPAWRTALWHLGATLDRMDRKNEALAHYIKSYNVGESDPARRTVIEHLYHKVHGSLAGLEEQINPAAIATANAQTAATNPLAAPAEPGTSPESTPTETPAPVPTPVAEVSTVPVPEATPSPQLPASSAPEPASPQANPPSTPSPSPTPDETPAPSPTPEAAPPVSTPSLADSPVERMHTAPKPSPTVVTIKGRVTDSSSNPVANVVVVLISPQGSVLASTTDAQGNYSFTVAPSTHGYRIIPSKEGFTFEPLDKLLTGATEDQKELNFIAVPKPSP
jgi:uncharacterized membrane protein YgcG/tetratricopeptide (TPR) repeat protein